MQIAVQKSWSNCTDSHLAIDCRLSGVTYTPLINAVSQSLHKKSSIAKLAITFYIYLQSSFSKGLAGLHIQNASAIIVLIKLSLG